MMDPGWHRQCCIILFLFDFLDYSIVPRYVNPCCLLFLVWRCATGVIHWFHIFFYFNLEHSLETICILRLIMSGWTGAAFPSFQAVSQLIKAKNSFVSFLEHKRCSFTNSPLIGSLIHYFLSQWINAKANTR